MEDSDIGVHQPNDRCSNNVADIYNEVEQPSGIEVVEEPRDNVVISIKAMLEKLPRFDGKCNIYRVPKQLRNMNEEAYAPQLISIGPFHHCSRKDLKATERYKLQGLNNYLRRIEELKSLEDLVKTARTWVKEASSCYAEPINMKGEDFVEMMLVDGCFIVEYLILNEGHLWGSDRFSQIQNNVDLSFYEGISSHIYRDLIKLENQLPFFVLQRLFDLIPQVGTPPIPFVQLTYNFFHLGWIENYEVWTFPREPQHFVNFLSYYCTPWPGKPKFGPSLFSTCLSFLFSLFSTCLSILRCHRQNSENKKFEMSLVPPSITELIEAGVTIKKFETAKSVMDISFKNGVLKIPPLVIDDHFETIVRNLIAFEQYPAGNKTYVIQYVDFLDDLISTEKDVSLLVKAEIIINYIGGSDKEVSELLNNLCKFVRISGNPYFDDIRRDLRKHCSGRWNNWKALLKHNYFNTPWAVISFFAATFLILLTLLQTIFSAISIS